VAITTFAGNLYVLDAGGPAAPGQIWRYLPTAGGAYDVSPQPWFQGDASVLQGATAFCVDGAIWVVRADGDLVRLSAGRPEPFALAGPPGGPAPAPLHGAAVYTEAGYGSLYVVDGPQRRLVQLSRTGRVEREIPDVTAPSDPVHGLWVDEPAGRALIVTESRLQEVGLAGGP
jgi:hypothetical protein